MFSPKNLKINTSFILNSYIDYPLKIKKIRFKIINEHANKFETIHYDDPMHSQK